MSCIKNRPVRGGAIGFTIIELLLVVAVIALIVAIALPAMNAVRDTAQRTSCLNNIRTLQQAHTTYMNDHRGRCVPAFLPHGGGGDPRYSWLTLLPEEYIDGTANLRSPGDDSPYWSVDDGGQWNGLALEEALRWLEENEDQTLQSSMISRWSSYGVNDMLAPIAGDPDVGAVHRMTQVPNPAATVHFLMMTEGVVDEGGDPSFARSDHVHVNDWAGPMGVPFDPDGVISMAASHMQVHAWGGKAASWDGRANYGFLDGSVGTHRFNELYEGRERNRFHPKHAASFVGSGAARQAGSY